MGFSYLLTAITGLVQLSFCKPLVAFHFCKKINYEGRNWVIEIILWEWTKNCSLEKAVILTHHLVAFLSV
jgi:hypothetical protein